MKNMSLSKKEMLKKLHTIKFDVFWKAISNWKGLEKSLAEVGDKEAKEIARSVYEDKNESKSSIVSCIKFATGKITEEARKKRAEERLAEMDILKKLICVGTTDYTTFDKEKGTYKLAPGDAIKIAVIHPEDDVWDAEGVAGIVKFGYHLRDKSKEVEIDPSIFGQGIDIRASWFDGTNSYTFRSLEGHKKHKQQVVIDKLNEFAIPIDDLDPEDPVQYEYAVYSGNVLYFRPSKIFEKGKPKGLWEFEQLDDNENLQYSFSVVLGVDDDDVPVRISANLNPQSLGMPFIKIVEWAKYLKTAGKKIDPAIYVEKNPKFSCEGICSECKIAKKCVYKYLTNRLANTEVIALIQIMSIGEAKSDDGNTYVNGNLYSMIDTFYVGGDEDTEDEEDEEEADEEEADEEEVDEEEADEESNEEEDEESDEDEDEDEDEEEDEEEEPEPPKKSKSKSKAKTSKKKKSSKKQPPKQVEEEDEEEDEEDTLDKKVSEAKEEMKEAFDLGINSITALKDIAKQKNVDIPEETIEKWKEEWEK